MNAVKKNLAFVLVFILLLSVLFYIADKKIAAERKPFDPENQEPSANLDILTSGTWEYDFDGCCYVLSLYDDQTFSNYCRCGSPVGASDLVEYYIYNDKNKTIKLFDSDGKYITSGKFSFIKEDSLKLSLFGESCTYKRAEDEDYE